MFYKKGGKGLSDDMQESRRFQYSENQAGSEMKGKCVEVVDRNKRRKLSISALVVALLMFSSIVTASLFSTSVKAAIYGAKYYYLSIERQNFKDAIKDLKQSYKQNYMSEYSYDYTFNSKLTGDFINSDDSLKKFADFLSGFEINAKYNANDTNPDDLYSTGLLTAKLKGTGLGGLDMKLADNQAILSFPDLSGKTIGVKATTTINEYIKAFLDDDKAFKDIFGISRDDYDKMVERYLKDVIFKAIPNEKVSFNRDASFQNIKCNSIVFNIDDKVLSSVYKALAKELSSDKEFKTVVSSSINYAYKKIALIEDEKPTPSEIDEDIKVLCDSLNDAAKEAKGTKLVYSVYFEDDGDVLSRELQNKADKFDMSLVSYQEVSGNDILKFNINSEGKKIINFEDNKKLDNGIYKGNFDLGILGSSVLAAEYTKEKDAKAGGRDAFVGEVKGSLKLNGLINNATNYVSDIYGYEDAEYSDESDSSNTDEAIEDINFSFVNKRQDSSTLVGGAEFSTKVDGKSFNLKIDTKLIQSDKANITKTVISLDNSIDMDDSSKLEDLTEEIMDNLTTKLDKIMPELKLKDD